MIAAQPLSSSAHLRLLSIIELFLSCRLNPRACSAPCSHLCLLCKQNGATVFHGFPRVDARHFPQQTRLLRCDR